MSMRGVMVLLSAGGLAAGCGSDGARPKDGGADAIGEVGPAPACGTVQPCGGEVTGNWMFVEECESAASIAESQARFSTMAEGSWCPGQTLAALQPEAAGSLVLSGDGTYVLALEYGGSLDIDFPASCIAGATCDDATAGFQAQIDEGTYPNPSVTSIACAGLSGCLCHASVYVARSESGTFSTAGNVLTFAATSGAVTNKSYCVAGNKLHILDVSTVQAIDSDLVAMKQ
jgi:hypothetical protein